MLKSVLSITIFLWCLVYLAVAMSGCLYDETGNGGYGPGHGWYEHRWHGHYNENHWDNDWPHHKHHGDWQ